MLELFNNTYKIFFLPESLKSDHWMMVLVRWGTRRSREAEWPTGRP